MAAATASDADDRCLNDYDVQQILHSQFGIYFDDVQRYVRTEDKKIFWKEALSTIDDDSAEEVNDSILLYALKDFFLSILKSSSSELSDSLRQLAAAAQKHGKSCIHTFCGTVATFKESRDRELGTSGDGSLMKRLCSNCQLTCKQHTAVTSADDDADAAPSPCFLIRLCQTCLERISDCELVREFVRLVAKAMSSCGAVGLLLNELKLGDWFRVASESVTTAQEDAMQKCESFCYELVSSNVFGIFGKRQAEVNTSVEDLLSSIIVFHNDNSDSKAKKSREELEAEISESRKRFLDLYGSQSDGNVSGDKVMIAILCKRALEERPAEDRLSDVVQGVEDKIFSSLKKLKLADFLIWADSFHARRQDFLKNQEKHKKGWELRCNQDPAIDSTQEVAWEALFEKKKIERSQVSAPGSLGSHDRAKDLLQTAASMDAEFTKWCNRVSLERLEHAKFVSSLEQSLNPYEVLNQLIENLDIDLGDVENERIAAANLQSWETEGTSSDLSAVLSGDTFTITIEPDGSAKHAVMIHMTTIGLSCKHKYVVELSSFMNKAAATVSPGVDDSDGRSHAGNRNPNAIKVLHFSDQDQLAAYQATIVKHSSVSMSASTMQPALSASELLSLKQTGSELATKIRYLRIAVPDSYSTGSSPIASSITDDLSNVSNSGTGGRNRDDAAGSSSSNNNNSHVFEMEHMRLRPKWSQNGVSLLPTCLSPSSVFSTKLGEHVDVITIGVLIEIQAGGSNVGHKVRKVVWEIFESCRKAKVGPLGTSAAVLADVIAVYFRLFGYSVKLRKNNDVSELISLGSNTESRLKHGVHESGTVKLRSTQRVNTVATLQEVLTSVPSLIYSIHPSRWFDLCHMELDLARGAGLDDKTLDRRSSTLVPIDASAAPGSVVTPLHKVLLKSLWEYIPGLSRAALTLEEETNDLFLHKLVLADERDAYGGPSVPVMVLPCHVLQLQRLMSRYTKHHMVLYRLTPSNIEGMINLFRSWWGHSSSCNWTGNRIVVLHFLGNLASLDVMRILGLLSEFSCIRVLLLYSEPLMSILDHVRSKRTIYIPSTIPRRSANVVKFQLDSEYSVGHVPLLIGSSLSLVASALVGPDALDYICKRLDVQQSCLNDLWKWMVCPVQELPLISNDDRLANIFFSLEKSSISVGSNELGLLSEQSDPVFDSNIALHARNDDADGAKVCNRLCVCSSDSLRLAADVLRDLTSLCKEDAAREKREKTSPTFPVKLCLLDCMENGTVSISEAINHLLRDTHVFDGNSASKVVICILNFHLLSWEDRQRALQVALLQDEFYGVRVVVLESRADPKYIGLSLKGINSSSTFTIRPCSVFVPFMRLSPIPDLKTITEETGLLKQALFSGKHGGVDKVGYHESLVHSHVLSLLLGPGNTQQLFSTLLVAYQSSATGTTEVSSGGQDSRSSAALEANIDTIIRDWFSAFEFEHGFAATRRKVAFMFQAITDHFAIAAETIEPRVLLFTIGCILCIEELKAGEELNDLDSSLSREPLFCLVNAAFEYVCATLLNDESSATPFCSFNSWVELHPLMSLAPQLVRVQSYMYFMLLCKNGSPNSQAFSEEIWQQCDLSPPFNTRLFVRNVVSACPLSLFTAERPKVDPATHICYFGSPSQTALSSESGDGQHVLMQLANGQEPNWNGLMEQWLVFPFGIQGLRNILEVSKEPLLFLLCIGETSLRDLLSSGTTSMRNPLVQLPRALHLLQQIRMFDKLLQSVRTNAESTVNHGSSGVSSANNFSGLAVPEWLQRRFAIIKWLIVRADVLGPIVQVMPAPAFADKEFSFLLDPQLNLICPTEKNGRVQLQLLKADVAVTIDAGGGSSELSEMAKAMAGFPGSLLARGRDPIILGSFWLSMHRLQGDTSFSLKERDIDVTGAILQSPLLLRSCVSRELRRLYSTQATSAAAFSQSKMASLPVGNRSFLGPTETYLRLKAEFNVSLSEEAFLLLISFVRKDKASDWTAMLDTLLFGLVFVPQSRMLLSRQVANRAFDLSLSVVSAFAIAIFDHINAELSPPHAVLVAPHLDLLKSPLSTLVSWAKNFCRKNSTDNRFPPDTMAREEASLAPLQTCWEHFSVGKSGQQVLPWSLSVLRSDQRRVYPVLDLVATEYADSHFEKYRQTWATHQALQQQGAGSSFSPVTFYERVCSLVGSEENVCFLIDQVLEGAGNHALWYFSTIAWFYFPQSLFAPPMWLCTLEDDNWAGVQEDTQKHAIGGAAAVATSSEVAASSMGSSRANVLPQRDLDFLRAMIALPMVKERFQTLIRERPADLGSFALSVFAPWLVDGLISCDIRKSLFPDEMSGAPYSVQTENQEVAALVFPTMIPLVIFEGRDERLFRKPEAVEMFGSLWRQGKHKNDAASANALIEDMIRLHSEGKHGVSPEAPCVVDVSSGLSTFSLSFNLYVYHRVVWLMKYLPTSEKAKSFSHRTAHFKQSERDFVSSDFSRPSLRHHQFGSPTPTGFQFGGRSAAHISTGPPALELKQEKDALNSECESLAHLVASLCMTEELVSLWFRSMHTTVDEISRILFGTDSESVLEEYFPWLDDGLATYLQGFIQFKEMLNSWDSSSSSSTGSISTATIERHVKRESGDVKRYFSWEWCCEKSQLLEHSQVLIVRCHISLPPEADLFGPTRRDFLYTMSQLYSFHANALCGNGGHLSFRKHADIKKSFQLQNTVEVFVVLAERILETVNESKGDLYRVLYCMTHRLVTTLYEVVTLDRNKDSELSVPELLSSFLPHPKLFTLLLYSLQSTKEWKQWEQEMGTKGKEQGCKMNHLQLHDRETFPTVQKFKFEFAPSDDVEAFIPQSQALNPSHSSSGSAHATAGSDGTVGVHNYSHTADEDEKEDFNNLRKRATFADVRSITEKPAHEGKDRGGLLSSSRLLEFGSLQKYENLLLDGRSMFSLRCHTKKDGGFAWFAELVLRQGQECYLVHNHSFHTERSKGTFSGTAAWVAGQAHSLHAQGFAAKQTNLSWTFFDFLSLETEVRNLGSGRTLVASFSSILEAWNFIQHKLFVVGTVITDCVMLTRTGEQREWKAHLLSQQFSSQATAGLSGLEQETSSKLRKVIELQRLLRIPAGEKFQAFLDSAADLIMGDQHLQAIYVEKACYRVIEIVSSGSSTLEKLMEGAMEECLGRQAEAFEQLKERVTKLVSCLLGCMGQWDAVRFCLTNQLPQDRGGGSPLEVASLLQHIFVKPQTAPSPSAKQLCLFVTNSQYSNQTEENNCRKHFGDGLVDFLLPVRKFSTVAFVDTVSTLSRGNNDDVSLIGVFFHVNLLSQLDMNPPSSASLLSPSSSIARKTKETESLMGLHSPFIRWLTDVLRSPMSISSKLLFLLLYKNPKTVSPPACLMIDIRGTNVDRMVAITLAHCCPEKEVQKSLVNIIDSYHKNSNREVVERCIRRKDKRYGVFVCPPVFPALCEHEVLKACLVDITVSPSIGNQALYLDIIRHFSNTKHIVYVRGLTVCDDLLLKWCCEFTENYPWRFIYFQDLNIVFNFSEIRDRIQALLVSAEPAFLESNLWDRNYTDTQTIPDIKRSQKPHFEQLPSDWTAELLQTLTKNERLVVHLVSPPGAGKTHFVKNKLFPDLESKKVCCYRFDCSDDQLVTASLGELLERTLWRQGKPSFLVADEFHLLDNRQKRELFTWILPRLNWLRVLLIGNRTLSIDSSLLGWIKEETNQLSHTETTAGRQSATTSSSSTAAVFINGFYITLTPFSMATICLENEENLNKTKDFFCLWYSLLHFLFGEDVLSIRHAQELVNSALFRCGANVPLTEFIDLLRTSILTKEPSVGRYFANMLATELLTFFLESKDGKFDLSEDFLSDRVFDKVQAKASSARIGLRMIILAAFLCVKGNREEHMWQKSPDIEPLTKYCLNSAVQCLRPSHRIALWCHKVFQFSLWLGTDVTESPPSVKELEDELRHSALFMDQDRFPLIVHFPDVEIGSGAGMPAYPCEGKAVGLRGDFNSLEWLRLLVVHGQPIDWNAAKLHWKHTAISDVIGFEALLRDCPNRQICIDSLQRTNLFTLADRSADLALSGPGTAFCDLFSAMNVESRLLDQPPSIPEYTTLKDNSVNKNEDLLGKEDVLAFVMWRCMLFASLEFKRDPVLGHGDDRPLGGAAVAAAAVPFSSNQPLGDERVGGETEKVFSNVGLQLLDTRGDRFAPWQTWILACCALRRYPVARLYTRDDPNSCQHPAAAILNVLCACSERLCDLAATDANFRHIQTLAVLWSGTFAPLLPFAVCLKSPTPRFRATEGHQLLSHRALVCLCFALRQHECLFSAFDKSCWPSSVKFLVECFAHAAKGQIPQSGERSPYPNHGWPTLPLAEFVMLHESLPSFIADAFMEALIVAINWEGVNNAYHLSLLCAGGVVKRRKGQRSEYVHLFKDYDKEGDLPEPALRKFFSSASRGLQTDKSIERPRSLIYKFGKEPWIQQVDANVWMKDETL